MQDAEALEALMAAIEAAKGELAGLGEGDEEELARALQRLSRSGIGGMGPQHGLGQGGAAGRDPDSAARAEDPARVRGQLDPEGRLGPRIPFRGIPKPKDAQAAFDATIEAAVGDAEESLGRDELPPGARPFVRRYFEALRNR